MCKYINFNNLRKKKGFTGGGVVVRWNSSPLWRDKNVVMKKNMKNNLCFEQ